MHHARASKSQWQSRRNMSLGPPVRRAHPASGATWNVQVVRGKMTSRCLWHACRALILGMVLMFLGAGMATIGYYAEHLSVGQEIRGNATVRVKNESRGFHLNNLSYVGPIVMGFGGFIVVASCVMTFEARDSAAKVVPARFKVSTTSRTPHTDSSSRRTTGTATQTGPQVNRWENHTGAFRTLPATTMAAAAAAAATLANECGTVVADRKALTAALVHFSRALGKPRSSKLDTPPKSPKDQRRVSRSGSVPNLATQQMAADSTTEPAPVRHLHHQSTMTATPPSSQRYQKSTAAGRHRCHRKSSMLQRSVGSNETSTASPLFLHPTAIGQRQWHQRHAVSVDEPAAAYKRPASGRHGSVESTGPPQSSTSRMLRDRNQRSDTARRHVLARQKPIEKDEPHGSARGRLRNTPSVELNVFLSARSRKAAAAAAAAEASLASSRTPSLDSRAVQTDLPVPFGRSESARRLGQREWSTPSDERECRSEFSIKSEPAAVRLLSGQSSSLEPCVPEETDVTDITDNDPSPLAPPSPAALRTVSAVSSSPLSGTGSSGRRESRAVDALIDSARAPAVSPETAAKRPDSLILKCSTVINSPVAPVVTPASVHRDRDPSSGLVERAASPQSSKQKFLYRSNSSRPYQRPRPKLLLAKEFDQIYFIGSNKEDEFYDSIDVIDERRSSNFKRSASSSTTGGLCRSSTVIYSEYCSGANDAAAAASSDAASAVVAMTTMTTEAVIEAIPNATGILPATDRINGVNDADVPSKHPHAVKQTTTTTTTTPQQQRATSRQCSVDEIVVLGDEDVDDRHRYRVVGDATASSSWRNGVTPSIKTTTTPTSTAVAHPPICAETDSDDSGGGGGRVAGGEQERTVPPPTTITVRAEIEDCGGHE